MVGLRRPAPPHGPLARLGAALGVSVLAHAGLLGTLDGLMGGAEFAAPPRPEPALRARLAPLASAEPARRELQPPAPRRSELAPPGAAPVLPGPRYLSAAELDGRPAPLTNIDLDYPVLPKPRDASVVARILINEQGRADEVQILTDDPEGAFGRLVRDAFGAAEYRPGTKGSRPVKSQMTVEVKFLPDAPAGGAGTGGPR